MQENRSEEVADIVDRMPTRFGVYTTVVVFSLVLILLSLGYIIEYPDTVDGSIIINTEFTTVKLVSNTAGNLTLLDIKSKDDVKAGQYIALIQNPANTAQIRSILALLNRYDLDKQDVIKAISLFPRKVSLGEIDSKYFAFLNAVQQLYDYKVHDLVKTQRYGYLQQISKLEEKLDNDKNLKATEFRNMNVAKSLTDKDSVLLSKKYATEDELARSTMNYLNLKGNFQRVQSELSNTESAIADYKSKVDQLEIQHVSRMQNLQADLVNTYDDLMDNLKAWEQRYVFKSPINGKVEFLQFWHNNQYVQSNENIFEIVPKQNKVIGQVFLPSLGAGKVKVGQDAIIKLNNYPYQEFGSILGKVRSISLVTNVMKGANQNNIDTYLVEISLPASLKTNFGNSLDFKYELKGTVDIISKHRRLLERLFDNLKSSADKM